MAAARVNAELKGQLEALGVDAPPFQATAKTLLAYLIRGDWEQTTAGTKERIEEFRRIQTQYQGGAVIRAHDQTRELGRVSYVAVRPAGNTVYRLGGMRIAVRYEIIAQVIWEVSRTNSHRLDSLVLVPNATKPT